MKKDITVLLFFIPLILFSCSRKTAEDTVREFHQYIQKGDFEAAADLCTSEGKKHLDDLEKVFPYLKNEASSISEIRCGKTNPKNTCWCAEDKGYVVQYELVNDNGSWKIDFRNYRPEVTASSFYLLMQGNRYDEAAELTTENGKSNISLLKNMSTAARGSESPLYELANVICEESNGITTCICINKAGNETRYTMEKYANEWKVDYQKTTPENIGPETDTALTEEEIAIEEDSLSW